MAKNSGNDGADIRKNLTMVSVPGEIKGILDLLYSIFGRRKLTLIEEIPLRKNARCYAVWELLKPKRRVGKVKKKSVAGVEYYGLVFKQIENADLKKCLR